MGLAICGVVLSATSSAATLMGDFRTSYICLAAPRAMFAAQLVGQLLGAVLTPMCFMLFFQTGQVRLALGFIGFRVWGVMLLRYYASQACSAGRVAPASLCQWRAVFAAKARAGQHGGTATTCAHLLTASFAFVAPRPAGERAWRPLPRSLCGHLPWHGRDRDQGLLSPAQALHHTHGRILCRR